MTRYKNTSGKSGVRAYETDINSIKVQFTDGSIYLYNTTKPGTYYLSQMQVLAITGRGLNTFINQHVGDNYAARLK